MQSSGELMKLMNGVMKTSVVAKTMMELSREMFKAGVMDEMVGDAMGSALDEEDMEEETEEQVGLACRLFVAQASWACGSK